ncbi:MAG: GHKL domain-containing protein [Lachnospiraceae bacterium]|nr:GHKL domain-containing protein [Lachnospiraceae bacterium]
MDIRQRINQFNRENRSFYIVDHDSGRYSLCLALSFLPKGYEHFGQEAFNRYAAEIGEPVLIVGRGFTHGSGYEWEHVFAKAFEGDPDSGRIEYDCEAGGFFCYADSLSLLENFGARFRAICMDGEKFAQLVSTALKEAAKKEEQGTEREIRTEKTGDAPKEYHPEKSADSAGVIMAPRQTGLRILYEDSKNGNILSMKKEKKMHGFGLNSINRITEEYDGAMILDFGHNRFTLTATMNFGSI